MFERWDMLLAKLDTTREGDIMPVSASLHVLDTTRDDTERHQILRVSESNGKTL